MIDYISMRLELFFLRYHHWRVIREMRREREQENRWLYGRFYKLARWWQRPR